MEQVYRTVRAEAESSKQERDKWMSLQYIYIFFFSNWELEYSCVLRSDQMKGAPYVPLRKLFL